MWAVEQIMQVEGSNLIFMHRTEKAASFQQLLSIKFIFSLILFFNILCVLLLFFIVDCCYNNEVYILYFLKTMFTF